MSTIDLIVGLGNPGREYEATRHNAGAWFVEELARQQHGSLKDDAKFFGLTGRISLAGRDIRLLIPTTFMNRSGRAVAAVANFYKIEPENILVAYDELDFEPGTARFKQGGSSSHNGLRDTVAQLANNKNFHRLRLGIGHPGNAREVTNYVLHKPGSEEKALVDAAIDEALRCLPDAVSGDWAKAMNRLHSFNAAEP